MTSSVLRCLGKAGVSLLGPCCFQHVAVLLPGAPLLEGDMGDFWTNRRLHNDELLDVPKGYVRASEFDSELHRLAMDDWSKGRMSKPQHMTPLARSNVRFEVLAYCLPACVHVLLLQARLLPRFGVSQGTKTDGTPKVHAPFPLMCHSPVHCLRRRCGRWTIFRGPTTHCRTRESGNARRSKLPALMVTT